jgi:hypothetical protein
MINAQEWLESKFSTAEEKARVKKLKIVSESNYANLGGIDYRDSEVLLISEATQGELNLSEFTNLERLFLVLSRD